MWGNVGLLLPLCCLQCALHSLQPAGSGMRRALACCGGWGTKLCPDTPELPPASLGPSRDGETCAASRPDHNLLVLSFTAAHNVTPQRPLEEGRLEEQGLNFRGFPQLAGKKSQAKQSSEQIWDSKRMCWLRAEGQGQ